MGMDSSLVRILVTGAGGQLGYSLQKTVPAHVNLTCIDRDTLDLSNLENIPSVLKQYNPDIIINTAAYTAVDKAESDVDLASVLNGQAPKVLACWCAENQASLIQISTDFVFDGLQSNPYLVDSPLKPLGVYGETKAEGESVLTLCQNAYVVRTSWVYSEHGSNFVKTMLKLAENRDQLGIIADQIGSPTYAKNLAKMIWKLIETKPVEKVWHYSDAGAASWYDFATAIFELGLEKGHLQKQPIVNPIRTEDYPTPAKRPAYSVLDKTNTWEKLGITPVHWRVALKEMLSNLVYSS